MRNYLMHEELWEAISGYPTGMNVSNVTKIRSDQKALTKICLTLESSAITHVRSATTAAEAWNALQNAYEDKGMGRRLYLERKLYRLRLEDFDNNIESYINAVISTAQDLADIGKVIDDASIAAILLGGLTSRYDPMIMTLENSNVQVTTEIVKSKLLNEISKESSIKLETAMKSKVDASSVESKAKQIVCYGCGEPGHKRPNCPLKKKKVMKRKNPTNKDSTSVSALGATNNYDMDKWYIDSGATKHMTSRRDWFVDLKPIDNKVTVANGTKIDAEGIGKISINTENNVNTINDVMYVPNLQINLLSVKTAVEKGFTIMFDKSGCNLFNSKTFSFTGDAVLHGSPCGGLYTLDCAVNIPQFRAYDVHSDSISKYQVWHKRLGHLCRVGMNLLKNSHKVIDYKDVDKNPCVACVQAKQARKPFKAITYKRATSILELIHSDLCGPMSVSSFQDNRNVNNTKTSTEPLVLSNSLPIQEETSTVEESFESAPGPTVESAPSHTVVAENQTAENDQFFEAIEEPIVSTGQTDGQHLLSFMALEKYYTKTFFKEFLIHLAKSRSEGVIQTE
ncbi:hypothetical protein HF086_011436 [Spodoptera exigua]|uniref:CCHC-type domain-containing protein n=1 Tax=Spodoptera exigua TaxID=7107 RepID=A0A922MSA8_SPOEX|nr:hypothetical protein HF086_011436 [Spodoptera exigua]